MSGTFNLRLHLPLLVDKVTLSYAFSCALINKQESNKFSRIYGIGLRMGCSIFPCFLALLRDGVWQAVSKYLEKLLSCRSNKPLAVYSYGYILYSSHIFNRQNFHTFGLLQFFAAVILISGLMRKCKSGGRSRRSWHIVDTYAVRKSG